MTFEEKLIDAFQLASAALVKYEKMAADLAAERARVAALAPRAASELVRYGRIEGSEKEACERAGHSHEQCLQLLIKLAAHRNSAEEAALGQPVDHNGQAANGQVKKASDYSNYVGRRSSEQPESWRRLAQGIGVG